MAHLFALLHFLGVAILVGGELLIALIAIRAQKDDTTLAFFLGFLYRIAAFMWVGLAIVVAGGVGLVLTLDYPWSGLFAAKLALLGFLIIVSVVMLFGLPKVKAAALQDPAGIRESGQFKRLDVLSRINLVLALAIMIISVLM